MTTLTDAPDLKWFNIALQWHFDAAKTERFSPRYGSSSNNASYISHNAHRQLLYLSRLINSTSFWFWGELSLQYCKITTLVTCLWKSKVIFTAVGEHLANHVKPGQTLFFCTFWKSRITQISAGFCNGGSAEHTNTCSFYAWSPTVCRQDGTVYTRLCWD